MDKPYRLTSDLSRSSLIFAGYILSYLAEHGAVDEASAIDRNQLVNEFSGDRYHRASAGPLSATINGMWGLQLARLVRVAGRPTGNSDWLPVYWLNGER